MKKQRVTELRRGGPKAVPKVPRLDGRLWLGLEFRLGFMFGRRRMQQVQSGIEGALHRISPRVVFQGPSPQAAQILECAFPGAEDLDQLGQRQVIGQDAIQ